MFWNGETDELSAGVGVAIACPDAERLVLTSEHSVAETSAETEITAGDARTIGGTRTQTPEGMLLTALNMSREGADDSAAALAPCCAWDDDEDELDDFDDDDDDDDDDEDDDFFPDDMDDDFDDDEDDDEDEDDDG